MKKKDYGTCDDTITADNKNECEIQTGVGENDNGILPVIGDNEKNGRVLIHRKKRINDEYTIVRKKDVKIIHKPTQVAKDHPEYDYHGLAGSSKKRRMRSFIITLKGKGEKKKFTSHKGEEFILVQQGSIKVVLQDREETLSEGDSIYYNSRIPHRIENLDPEKSIILAVFYGA